MKEKYPKIRNCHQIYTLGEESTIYIGRGMEKVAVRDPETGVEDFLLSLDGKNSTISLKGKYPKAEEWLSGLSEAGVIEWNNEDQELIKEDHPLNRYSRQIFHFALYNNSVEESEKVQNKLLRTKISVLGIGAGGTTLIRYLNSVGIGSILFADFDKIALSNMATHTTIDESSVGQLKTEVVDKMLREQNSETNLEKVNIKLTGKNDIIPLIEDSDFVIQAFDRPLGEAVKWTNEACVELGKPYSSIGQTDKTGRVGNIVVPGVTPCAECIGLKSINTLRHHSAAPLTGPLVAVLAGIMVHEIVKYITGYAHSTLLGTTLSIDSETWEIHKTRHEINKKCRICSQMQKR